ncbi:MAG: hypothetical protein ABR570_09510, partial [Burkholderiales bacterium]
MRRALAVCALVVAATPALALEATVIRPTSIIAQEWPYYVLLDGRVITDVRSGERTRVAVPPGTRSLAIQCPKAIGGYAESRVDYNFEANPRASFVITPQSDCVKIEALDEKSAMPYLNRTRPRPADRLVEYDRPREVIGPTVSAPSASAPPTAAVPSVSPPSPAPEATAAVAAATQAWIDAFNARDAARLASLYDTDAVLADTNEPRSRTGSAA